MLLGHPRNCSENPCPKGNSSRYFAQSCWVFTGSMLLLNHFYKMQLSILPLWLYSFADWFVGMGSPGFTLSIPFPPTPKGKELSDKPPENRDCNSIQSTCMSSKGAGVSLLLPLPSLCTCVRGRQVRILVGNGPLCPNDLGYMLIFLRVFFCGAPSLVIGILEFPWTQ